jgi:outer membrane protein assembly factor BamD (BamD/ComL family)
MTSEMETMYKDALMNVIFGQFEEASKKLKNLISLYPDNPDAFHLLGTMHE